MRAAPQSRWSIANHPGEVMQLHRGCEVVPKRWPPGLELGRDDSDRRAGNDELAVFAAEPALLHVVVDRRHHPWVDAGDQHRFVIALCRQDPERQARRQPGNSSYLHEMAAIEAAEHHVAAA